MSTKTALNVRRVVAGGLVALVATVFVQHLNASDCTRTSVGLTPINDLGAASYRGFQGGLYPLGKNTRPSTHELNGIDQADTVQPLDTLGRPAAVGHIGLLSIGMSNATQEFQAFLTQAAGDAGINPRLTIVDGAQSGVTAENWASASCSCWTTVSDRLSAAGITAAQVQVAWVKVARSSPKEAFPTHATLLQDAMTTIAQELKQRFPNIKLAYFSSRIYAGYSITKLNPEPFAYESGFSVKWLIEDQINGSVDLNYNPQAGPVKAPWLAWGPYMWADGTVPRTDGLTWLCSDFAADGTHPGPAAQAKVADMLMDFFKTDTTAKGWFLAASPVPPPDPGTRLLTVTSTGSGTGLVRSQPAGIDCGSDCSEAFAKGATVTLKVAADINSTFLGWSGACSGTRACTLTLDADKAVTASFGVR